MLRAAIRATLAAAVAVLCLLTGTVAVAQTGSADQRFLAGLRERGLFRLAETYCTARLAEADLPDDRRAELTIELSLALTEQALNLPPEEREPVWRRAWEVTERFAAEHPDASRLLLVRLQGALAVLARGELARQESEVVVASDRLVEEAKHYLRTAIGELDRLAIDVEEVLRQFSLPGHRSVSQRAGELCEDELAALQQHIEYQLARAYRNQGLCYPAESLDRINSITQAAELLEDLAKLAVEHPLGWKSRLDEAVCYRLLGDYAKARLKLDMLRTEGPPPDVELRAQAERLRIALDQRAWQAVSELVGQGRELAGQTSPELDYAWLETYLAGWRAADEAGDAERSAQLQGKANEMARLIQRLYGPYWIRRSQMLMARYVRATGGGDVEMLAQAAENAYHGGQLDEALAAYDRARALAEEKGEAARAFELGYTAAAIEHKRGRHLEAMSRFRQLATAMPTQPNAAKAHLVAIYHAGAIAREGSAGSLDVYAELLAEHLKHWPDGSGADEVRWRLGRLREHQRDWQNALAAYRAVSADFPQYDQVVKAAGRCYLGWLDELRARGEPTAEIAASAAEWFESLVTGAHGRWPERWSPLARHAAVTAARLRLDFTSGGFARAEQVLTAALGGATDAPAEWTASARALLVFSLAGQGKHPEAAAVLDQISAGPPGELLDMLEGLSGVAAKASPEVRPKLAELELSTVALLQPRRDQLGPAAQKGLDRIHAQALADGGRRAEALKAYAWLAETYPRDGGVQEQYAGLLAAGDDSAELEKALGAWRAIEKNAETAGPRWFRAKYEIALLHYRMNRPERAAALIRQLEILHPEMGGAEMKPRFLDLLRRCGP